MVIKDTKVFPPRFSAGSVDLSQTVYTHTSTPNIALLPHGKNFFLHLPGLISNRQF